ncbi:MAG: glucosamine-6-phosphate deaminase [Mycoplasma sp.]
MNIKKFENQKIASKFVADIIIENLKTNPSIRLGLATGSTPVALYADLVNDHKTNKTDWSKVITFNLDEYQGVAYDNDMSYHKFMKNELFDHVNIDIKNTHFPEEGKSFEDEIASENGIDIQILGIGVNGHIGFNEPGSEENSLTRIVELTPSTIEVNGKKYFNGNLDEVPKTAISMGLETIMRAKKIILLAFGKEKADAIQKLASATTFDKDFPASVLVKHKDVLIITDEEATALLK